MSQRKTIVGVLSGAAICVTFAALSAQAPTFKRTVLQQGDLSAAGREAVTAMVEIPAGVVAGKHTHPGEEIGYVLEGTVLLEVDGQPAKTLKAGDTFLVKSGAVHNATNKGTVLTKVLATYVVEKGKPMATPVK
jgi:quercetin dioxygenase-like cupin family protein